MYRKIPPLEVVEEILRSLKLDGLRDKRWFSKEDLTILTTDEWMPLLEPYYLPWKAKRYLGGEMTTGRVVTVLRHLLKVHDIELKVQEKVVNGKKTTLYQIFYNYLDPVVRFD